MKTLEVVVGAQYGSEAKGHVVQRLTEKAQRENSLVQVIRVAGPNAGHTGYDEQGNPWALRQVPVAAVVKDPAILGIAAGSEIDPPVLLSEYDALRDSGLLVNKMLWVHGEATVITNHHKAIENGATVAATDGTYATATDLVGAIGSTGKGIGAARADRLMRRAKRVIDDAALMDALRDRGIPVAGPEHNPGASYQHTIIEGTQGFGLGLRAGHYPQCTSSDCRAIDFMSMAGISPWNHHVKVWAVARMYPIRVAGNSGPLKNETTWAELGLPEERTTVTKKVRRVGMPDWELVGRAVRANGGAPAVRLAVTMVDQMFPFMKDKNYHDPTIEVDDFRAVRDYLGHIRRQTCAEIGMVTTGPNKATFMEGEVL